MSSEPSTVGIRGQSSLCGGVNLEPSKPTLKGTETLITPACGVHLFGSHS